MLIDTSVTIAYKCSSCGSFEFYNISLFAFLYKKESSFSCRCKKSAVTIKQEGDAYLVGIPCIGCGSEHVYLLGKREIILNELNTFNCPETGMQLCFLGKDEVVRKKVDSLEEEFDELMDMYGYDSYFKNTQVMFDSLNKIHDIAEQGNLYCECGSTDIDLVLLPDRILLKCARCSMSKIIKAATNKDLKDIMKRQYMLIPDDGSEYMAKEPGELLGKTDNK